MEQKPKQSTEKNPELTKESLDIFRGIDDYDPPFFRTNLCNKKSINLQATNLITLLSLL